MGDGAAESEFDIGDSSSGWEVEDVFESHSRLESDVVNFARSLIMEMPVLMKVRTVAAGLAIKMDLSDDAVLGQGLQAVVNRG